MTSSQWLDIAVLAVAFVAAISGWRSGALGSLLSFVGVVLGAIAGVLLAPHLVSHIDGPRSKLFAALFLILALVVIGEVAGVVLGRAVRGAIRNPGVRTVDSVIGVALQLVVVLIAAWLLATPLTSVGSAEPGRRGRGSQVSGQVDDLAPQWLKTVPGGCRRCSTPPGCPRCWNRSAAPRSSPSTRRTPALAANPVVAATAPSVLKIRGVAPSCQKVLEGTGFVIAPNRVMTNAHVVAGSDSVTVEADGQSYDATRGLLRPRRRHLDPGRAGPAVAAAGLRPRSGGAAGTDAVVLGYPGGGTSRPHRPGSARPSSSTDPTSTAPPRSPARCTRSEALCGKAIPVAR